MAEERTNTGSRRRVLAGMACLPASLQFGEPARADTAPRIVGGIAVPEGEYPFMVALLDRQRGSTVFQQQFCGAALIDANSVLTAAHCVTGNSAVNLRAPVGRTVLDANQGKIRNVSRINIHPSHRPLGDSSFDAAVLTLRRPVTGVKPVKLATASRDNLETPGRLATVAGWGNTIAQPPGGITGNSFPQRMREVQVPIVSDAKAGKAYGSSYVPSLMISAGQKGKDSCQGDSGGAAVRYHLPRCLHADRDHQLRRRMRGSGLPRRLYRGEQPLRQELHHHPGRKVTNHARREGVGIGKNYSPSPHSGYRRYTDPARIW